MTSHPFLLFETAGSTALVGPASGQRSCARPSAAVQQIRSSGVAVSVETLAFERAIAPGECGLQATFTHLFCNWPAAGLRRDDNACHCQPIDKAVRKPM